MSRPRRVLTVLACAASACALSAPSRALAAPSNGQGVVLSLAGHERPPRRQEPSRRRRARLLHERPAPRRRRERPQEQSAGERARPQALVPRSRRAQLRPRRGRAARRRLVLHGRRRQAARPPRALRRERHDRLPGARARADVARHDRDRRAGQRRDHDQSAVARRTDIGDGELHASGVVTDDEGEGAFAIRADDGSGLRFDDPQQLFEAADAAWCDVVDVAFHKSGRRLIADGLRVTGQSEEGDCAERRLGRRGRRHRHRARGRRLLADGRARRRQPVTTIPVDDASLLDGIEVGDDVAVTLDEDGTAIDVELLDWSDDPGSARGRRRRRVAAQSAARAPIPAASAVAREQRRTEQQYQRECADGHPGSQAGHAVAPHDLVPPGPTTTPRRTASTRTGVAGRPSTRTLQPSSSWSPSTTMPRLSSVARSVTRALRSSTISAVPCAPCALGEPCVGCGWSASTTTARRASKPLSTSAARALAASGTEHDRGCDERPRRGPGVLEDRRFAPAVDAPQRPQGRVGIGRCDRPRPPEDEPRARARRSSAPWPGLMPSIVVGSHAIWSGTAWRHNAR